MTKQQELGREIPRYMMPNGAEYPGQGGQNGFGGENEFGGQSGIGGQNGFGGQNGIPGQQKEVRQEGVSDFLCFI